MQQGSSVVWEPASEMGSEREGVDGSGLESDTGCGIQDLTPSPCRTFPYE
jgi:hypothetical protein